jgi:hypothetical protein
MAKSENLPEEIFREGVIVYSGPFVFTQVMDFMPLKTFQRCVERYQGNFSIKHFTCIVTRQEEHYDP